jgi:hypothetical protein
MPRLFGYNVPGTVIGIFAVDLTLFGVICYILYLYSASLALNRPLLDSVVTLPSAIIAELVLNVCAQLVFIISMVLWLIDRPEAALETNMYGFIAYDIICLGSMILGIVRKEYQFLYGFAILLALSNAGLILCSWYRAQAIKKRNAAAAAALAAASSSSLQKMASSV